MRRMYLDADGKPWFVSDQATAPPAAAARPVDRARPAASTGQQAATGGAAGTGQAATQRSVEGTSDGE
jgi:hypothetical protein